MGFNMINPVQVKHSSGKNVPHTPHDPVGVEESNVPEIASPEAISVIKI